MINPTITLLIFALTFSFNGIVAQSQSAYSLSARNQKVSLMNRAVKPSLQTLNPARSRAELLDEVQKRAFRFFLEKLDPETGLVNDRSNNSKEDDYTVASIASTGYALAALPIAVERKWVTRAEAEKRARTTLDFFLSKTENVHGWYYHFVDRRTGK